ncbi:MAG: M48 family metalloprotease [Gammaproteobacteria bacterium]
MVSRYLKFPLISILVAGLLLGVNAVAADAPAAHTTPSHALVLPAYGYQPDYLSQSPSDFDLPQLGYGGANVLSVAQEFQIGVQVMDQLRAAGAILNDPLVTNYINDLGHQLSSNSGDPTLHFQYFVINSPVINAVTLPGGFIGVNYGLFLDSDNEDELAGVMAHETSHVTQRTIARTAEYQKDHSLINIATMLAGLLIGAISGNPDVAMGAIQTAAGFNIQHQIAFTRTQEEEADRVGIQTLARAGFQPQGMIEFFQKMQHQDALNGYGYIPQFLLDHPQDATREAYLMARAISMHVPPRPNSRDYAIMKARVRVLESNDLDGLVKFFQSKIDDTHGWNQDAARYGLALTYSRIDRGTAAIQLMQQLCDKYDDVVAFRIGLADAQMASNQIADAKLTYAQAMRLFPDSTPLTLSYARDLIDAGQPQNAVSVLIALSMQTNEDPDVLRLLAKAYSKAGNIGESHYYTAEYYYRTGLMAAAADQLHIALATPGIDGMQRQRYQARLDRLQAWARANRQSLQQSGPSRG